MHYAAEGLNREVRIPPLIKFWSFYLKNSLKIATAKILFGIGLIQNVNQSMIFKNQYLANCFLYILLFQAIFCLNEVLVIFFDPLSIDF